MYMEMPDQLSVSNTININGIYTRQEDINNKPSWINEVINTQICFKNLKWIIESTVTNEVYFTEPSWPNVEVVE